MIQNKKKHRGNAKNRNTKKNKHNAKNLAKQKINFEVLDRDINNQVNLFKFIQFLSKMEINNLLIESGPKIITSFINADLVDRIILCRSGKLFVSDAISFLENQNLKKITQSKNFILKESFMIKEDVIEFWDIKK